jgi:hypothetical protein
MFCPVRGMRIRSFHKKFRESIHDAENDENDKDFPVPGRLFFSPEHERRLLVYFYEEIKYTFWSIVF